MDNQGCFNGVSCMLITLQYKLIYINIPNFIYGITYSMVQSPSWKANWFAASQEIPRTSPNRKAHYRTHSVCHLSLSWASPI